MENPNSIKSLNNYLHDLLDDLKYFCNNKVYTPGTELQYLPLIHKYKSYIIDLIKLSMHLCSPNNILE